MDEIGKILFTRHFDTDTVTAEWQGPPTIWISPELMADADPRWWKREGDYLTICQFRLKIIGRTKHGLYIAERLQE